MFSLTSYVTGMKFNVQFTVSKFPLRQMHRAVAMSEIGEIQCPMLSTVFPVSPNLKSKQVKMITSPINRLVGQNHEQLVAVSTIASIMLHLG